MRDAGHRGTMTAVLSAVRQKRRTSSASTVAGSGIDATSARAARVRGTVRIDQGGLGRRRDRVGGALLRHQHRCQAGGRDEIAVQELIGALGGQHLGGTPLPRAARIVPLPPWCTTRSTCGMSRARSTNGSTWTLRGGRAESVNGRRVRRPRAEHDSHGSTYDGGRPRVRSGQLGEWSEGEAGEVR